MAQFAIPVGIALAGGIAGTLAAKAMAPKSTPTPVAQPLPTRIAAADAARNDDMFRRRRGAGANELTGRGGAEARTPGAKALLGQ